MKSLRFLERGKSRKAMKVTKVIRKSSYPMGTTKCKRVRRTSRIHCHAPIPGPTRSADPNRFPGRETQDWDSLPEFFFFF